MSRKKSGSYSHTTFNTTRINGRRRYLNKTTTKVDIDSKGNKTTTINSSNVDIDKRINLFSSLFKISLVLIFGGYFFSNGVKGFKNADLVSTANTQYITNVINGTEYNYRVHSTDYDYTIKLNQLNSLRNVFDLNQFIYDDVTNLVQPTDSLFLEGGQYYQYNDIYNFLINNDSPSLVIATHRYTNLDASFEFTYLLPTPDFDYNTYGWFYDLFVNSNNFNDYFEYMKEVNQNKDSWYYGIYNFFRVINAPVIWVGNFVYDIGVIISFLINW